MKSKSEIKKPAILFIPESGIYPFIRGLSILGDAISQQGRKVYITHDTGQMYRSPLMSMYKTPLKKTIFNKIFLSLITNRYFYSAIKKYGFNPIQLSDFVDKQLIRKIDTTVNDAKTNIEDLVYDGFPVGEIAQYDFVLETKFPYSSNLSDYNKALYRLYVKNTILSIIITNRICEKYHPSLFMTFNEYAQCQGVKYSAKRHGVRFMALTYPVHLNIDASRFSVWDSTYQSWRYQHCRNWIKVKNLPILKKDVNECWTDSLFRMYGHGSHIFSSSKNKDIKNVFEQLKLDRKRKTIVVYTSSQDERITSELTMKIWGEKNPIIDAFSSQVEWLSFLRKYAETRKDIQLVVRIHPREGSRQFGFDSKHLNMLKREFKRKTKNFQIVWPDNPISSYDLLELSDICLVAWSFMGMEAARIGIPVLSYTANMFYPMDRFIQIADNRKEYKKKLDEIINMKYCWEDLVQAVRYYHWRTFIPSLDLSDILPSDYDDDSYWPKVPKSKTKIINNILFGKQDLIENNIKLWKNSLTKKTIFEEAEAMKKGIRRFIFNIFNPPANIGLMFRVSRFFNRKIRRNPLWIPSLGEYFKDYRLIFTEDKSKMRNFLQMTKKDSGLVVLMANNLEALFIFKGKIKKRISPLAVRLAKLHQNA